MEAVGQRHAQLSAEQLMVGGRRGDAAQVDLAAFGEGSTMSAPCTVAAVLSACAGESLGPLRVKHEFVIVTHGT